MNESYWWSLFLKGDKHAFSVIFLAYHDDLFRYGLKLTRDQETVNDCIQNLFLKLWNNRNNLKPVDSVKPYLFRSLRNHIIDTLELKKETIPLESAIEEFFVVEFTYEDFIITSETDKETHERVIKLLNQLTGRQRHAIYLRYFEDMDFEAISGIMNMNVQSVRNLISRGLLLMRSLGVIIPFYLILER
jgi:RNA polymerase sigma factor (sigma-70 family)